MRGDDIDTTAFRLVFVPCAMLALVLIVTMLDWKDDPKGSWTALSTMAVCVAAVVAVFVYRQTAERNDEDAAYRRSERLLTECRDILDRTVRRFVGGDAAKPPPNDPMLWIGVARSLNTYLHLADKIENPVHKDIVRVYEDEARAAIYNVFHVHGDSAFTESYFSKPIWPEAIAPIFEFGSWRGDAPDPLWHTDPLSVFARKSVAEYSGLYAYLQTKEKYAPVLYTDDAEEDAG